MLELSTIQKRRKLFYRVKKYILIASPLIYLLMNFIKDQYDYVLFNVIEKVALGSFIITAIYFGFTTWFPVIKEFNVRGSVIFDYDTIIKKVYNKDIKFNISELNELKFNINGYWGQDLSYFPNIYIADGAKNFLTIKTRDHNIEKIEFYLANKKHFNSLQRYIMYYEDKIKVKSN